MNEFNTKNYVLKPVYPSPSQNRITLDYSLKNNKDIVSFKIFDKSGKIILSNTLENSNTDDNSYEINISGLATGNYYLSFNAGGVSVTQKFVKIK